MHLQAKGLAIHGEDYGRDADHPEGHGDCWCNKTGKPLGPDRDTVTMTSCSNPDRGCHEEY
jgi:hypothetical protein